MPTKSRALPVNDTEMKSFEFQGEVFYVRDKFKVGRFLKSLADAPVDAIEIVLAPVSFEKFLDTEMSMDELKDFLEGLSEAMAGSPSKN